MELARMGRDRAQGSPGRESTESSHFFIVSGKFFYLAGAIVAGGDNESEDVGAVIIRLLTFARVPTPCNFEF